MIIGSKEK
jgi:hypothetical protein